MYDYSKQDWIWLMSLVLKFEQMNNNKESINFWNWAIETYQPEGFTKIEE